MNTEAKQAEKRYNWQQELKSSIKTKVFLATAHPKKLRPETVAKIYAPDGIQTELMAEALMKELTLLVNENGRYVADLDTKDALVVVGVSMDTRQLPPPSHRHIAYTFEFDVVYVKDAQPSGCPDFCQMIADAVKAKSEQHDDERHAERSLDV